VNLSVSHEMLHIKHRGTLVVIFTKFFVWICISGFRFCFQR